MANKWETSETMTAVADYFGGLQNHCRWWLQWNQKISKSKDFNFTWNQKTLAPSKESYDQTRQHIKSREITLPRNIHPVKTIIFPVVLYGCESWTIKKTVLWIIDAFELWCWRRLLKVPWAARRSNQSILKEISPEYSLEGLMLKLKLQYFRHLM